MARLAALLCSAVVCGAVVVQTLWSSPSRADGDRTFALCLIAMLLVSPITWDHYLTLLLLPLGMHWVRLPPAGGSRWAFRLLLAIVWIPPTAVWCLLLHIPPDAWRHTPATPWQAATVVSLQLYALLGLLVLTMAAGRASRGESAAGPEGVDRRTSEQRLAA